MQGSRNETIYIISEIIGWIYFLAWTISFYPQLYTNYKRKSVIGLNLDFLTLNITGFICYSLFNLGLYFRPNLKQVANVNDFYNSTNPVQINDLVFSLHALVVSIFIGVQALIYERGDQTISRTAKLLLAFIYLTIIVCLAFSVGHILTWINFLYALSYVKVFITAIKYIPQAYLNYRRKSTVGWNVLGVILDAIGGSFSITQMFLLSCAITNPILSTSLLSKSNCVSELFFGNPTKMLLGILSLLYDAFLVYQHYVLYPNLATDNYQEIPGSVLPESPEADHIPTRPEE